MQRIIACLPSDWQQQGMRPSRPGAGGNTGTKAIAAAIAAEQSVLDGKPQKLAEKESKHRFGVLRTPFDRAKYVIRECTLTEIRQVFDAVESVYTLHERKEYEHKLHMKLPPNTPPADEVIQNRVGSKAEEEKKLVLDFFDLLSVESVAKAWKHQATLYSTDRPDKGDAAKASRLNQLWVSVKGIAARTQPERNES